MKLTTRLKDFKPDEKILTVAKKHWFVYVRDLVGFLILFFLPFFAVPVLGIFLEAGAVIVIPEGFGFFFASFWALIIWQLMFARWTDIYFDTWIITNWRIIDIEQKGFFNRNVATLLNLDHIEDVTTDINGLLGTLLNYGDLQVQTAAAHREFVIHEIGSPRRTEGIIRKAQEERLGLRSAA